GDGGIRQRPRDKGRQGPREQRDHSQRQDRVRDRAEQVSPQPVEDACESALDLAGDQIARAGPAPPGTRGGRAARGERGAAYLHRPTVAADVDSESDRPRTTITAPPRRPGGCTSSSAPRWPG